MSGASALTRATMALANMRTAGGSPVSVRTAAISAFQAVSGSVRH